MNRAYLSLQTDGYLKSVRGKGVFVTDIAASTTGETGEVEAVLDDCLKACKALGLSYDEAVSRMRVRATRLKMQEATPHRAEGTNVITLRAGEDSTKKEV